MAGWAQKVFRGKKDGTYAEITQQLYSKNVELAHTNKILSLLRTIDNLVLESHDELEVLCQHIAEAIVEHSSYPLVAIMANPPHKDFLSLFGWSSPLSGLPKIDPYRIKLDDHDEWLVQPERSVMLDLQMYSDKQIARVLEDTEEDIATLRQALPIKTVGIIKLLSRHRLVGLMTVGFTEQMDSVSENDKMLLERLGEAVGIALDNKLLFEENQQVLRQQQKLNEKLKAMDETKDEFISMASHQLRTPLTSVKGYLSMVLEGDAGKLNDMQRKLLEQSFTSSQRMVFLIADLLNLSRLRTGKFLVEPIPTNLSDIIQGEVEQLKETAAGRNLKLEYNKPETFPTLMLDETKIRQVIMNFVDNAIYYTPSGGKIVIGLVETPQSVEFTVKDSGIGVPKSEQQHLFTKFYRAGNAQKARPDGTGLGLFMAKKVIVALGGALIFTSKEGQGSTFGFSFSKAKIQVPDKPTPSPDTKS